MWQLLGLSFVKGQCVEVGVVPLEFCVSALPFAQVVGFSTAVLKQSSDVLHCPTVAHPVLSGGAKLPGNTSGCEHCLNSV